MDKTNADELMLKMIASKIEEIKEKFSRGEALTQEDVNMLLYNYIKSQFNHLDDKLNEVTAAVILLEGKFENLKLDIDVRLEKLTNKLFLGMTGIMGVFLAIVGIILTLFQVFGK